MDQHTRFNLKEQTGELKNTGMKGRLNGTVKAHPVCVFKSGVQVRREIVGPVLYPLDS